MNDKDIIKALESCGVEEANCRNRYDLVHKLKQMKPPKSTKKASEKMIIFESKEEELRAKFNDLV